MSGKSRSSRPSPRRYPPELKDQAVRMVRENIERSGKPHGTIAQVARQLGIGPGTVRNWCRNGGSGSSWWRGSASDDVRRIAELEREVRELRRDNEILKGASTFLVSQLSSAATPR
ncbi:transposase [Sphaerisporangium sp. NPDC049002]|uniref:transposase n=1 Tax=Sphaerisporangium sp. NPDC049002 TaxID=3155392 RepID=UPI0033D9D6B8